MSLWINGDWQSGRGPARSKHNPVSQALLWQGNDADAGQVALAVTAARAAFPAWARQPFAARKAIAEKFASLLEANKGELTRIIAQETGKPRWEAATEITAMINKIAISVNAYHSRTGKRRPRWRTERRRCAIGRTACWRSLAPTIFPDTCLTGISFRRCWREIPWYSNPAS